MAISMVFPEDVLAYEVSLWASAHGLRLVSDLRGNLVFVAGG